jgi:hypothetical protein
VLDKMESVKSIKINKCYSISEENIVKIDLLKREVEKELKEKYGVNKKMTSSSMVELLVNNEVKARGLM